MERIVMEGTPLTLEERLERQANEIRTKEQQIEQLKAENDHWQEVCADLHIEYGEQTEAQQQEIDRLQQWVNDLQSGMYVNCVYCGHRYGPEDEVPASLADVLKEHIEHCPKHPMSKLKQEIWQAKQERDSQQRVAIREMEKVESLTADKDEQAGQIMRYDTVLRQARETLSGVNVSRCPYCWGRETHNDTCAVKKSINAIDALLGGNDDV